MQNESSIFESEYENSGHKTVKDQENESNDSKEMNTGLCTYFTTLKS